MLHRGIRFAHAAALAFSVVFAFLFMRGLDEADPLGKPALVDISDSDDSVGALRIVQEISSFADAYGVGVARKVSDRKKPDEVRHLYLASGNNAFTEEWLTKGYPEFSRGLKTQVHPIFELGRLDPRGSYYIFGSPSAAEALASRLHKLGLQATVSHPLPYSELALGETGDPLFLSFWIVALALVTLTGASVLLNARVYAVLRLQGKSLADILLRDLKRVRHFWLLTLSVISIAAAIFLGIYNGFAWIGTFASISTGIAVAFEAMILAVHAAGVALTFRINIVGALKGELPSRAAYIGMYVVRIPALLLALSIAMDISLSYRDVLTRQENQEIYSTLDDAVSLRLNGAYATRLNELNNRIGPWLREADGQGEIVVAGRKDLQTSAPGKMLPPGEILIVNDAYLKNQKVFDSAGERYKSDFRGNGKIGSPSVRVIVPDKFSSLTPEIVNAVSGILDPGQARSIPFETFSAGNGQNLFAYNSGTYAYSSAYTAGQDRSLVRDPILAVVPNGSSFLTNDGYATFAMQEGVVFPDASAALQGIEKEKLQTFVTSVRPIGQKTAAEFSDAVNDLRLQLFNVIAAVAVLLIVGLGVCIVYSRKNSQAIFVRHVSGWRYVSNHRFILSVEVAIAAVFATRVPFVAWQERKTAEGLAAAGVPSFAPTIQLTTLDLGIILALAAFVLSSVLIALSYFHGRTLKEGTTEA